MLHNNWKQGGKPQFFNHEFPIIVSNCVVRPLSLLKNWLVFNGTFVMLITESIAKRSLMDTPLRGAHTSPNDPTCIIIHDPSHKSNRLLRQRKSPICDWQRLYMIWWCFKTTSIAYVHTERKYSKTFKVWASVEITALTRSFFSLIQNWRIGFR